MKKVLSMIAALLLCVGTQAQIVSSRSAIVKTEKQASSTQWFLRAGLNIMNFSGDGAEGADSNIGYNATFGYQKPLGSTGGYWGMEFGLGSRGFKVEDTKCMAGQLIERTLHEQGRTVTWFATQLCCTRPNVYKIFEKRISTSTCSGASPASSAMIFSAIFPTASIPETSPVYPNRIQFRIVLGTMLSPGSILLSHTFAGILTYNHKRT